MKILKYIFVLALSALAAVSCRTKVDTGWRIDDPDNVFAEPEDEDKPLHSYTAPMCWSIYEYAYEAEENTDVAIDMTREEWARIMDWIKDNLLPYGYDMVLTDGFIKMWCDNTEQSRGYMTHYGEMKLTELVQMCKERGLRLGIYDNPLWIHGDDNYYVPGTGYKLGSLKYNSSDKVLRPEQPDLFPWAVPSHKGCEEFIEGFFKYYKELGVDLVRMDFMCLFETGDGAGDEPENLGKGYGREEYELALKYICKYARKYGVFTSIVMPNLMHWGELELQYCNMYRFSADTFTGGWGHVSSWWQGSFRGGEWCKWPSSHNIFDGYIGWSPKAGAGCAIPDGDFIRLNRFDTDEECKTELTLHAVAGGPLLASDRPEMVGERLKYYQNRELIKLIKDRFVGKPLSTNIQDERSQIWWGRLSEKENGDYIIALFNRTDDWAWRAVNFSDLGIEGSMKVLDLWHNFEQGYPHDEGYAESVQVYVPAHGVKLVRLTR